MIGVPEIVRSMFGSTTNSSSTFLPLFPFVVLGSRAALRLNDIIFRYLKFNSNPIQLKPKNDNPFVSNGVSCGDQQYVEMKKSLSETQTEQRYVLLKQALLQGQGRKVDMYSAWSDQNEQENDDDRNLKSKNRWKVNKSISFSTHFTVAFRFQRRKLNSKLTLPQNQR